VGEIRGLFRKSDEYLLKAFQKLYPITDELRGIKFDCIDWTFILNGIYIPGYLIYSNEYNEKFKISIIDKINRLKNTKKIIESAIGNIKLIDGGYIDTQSMINWTKNNGLNLKVPEFIEEEENQRSFRFSKEKKEINANNRRRWALLCIALLEKVEGIKREIFSYNPECFKKDAKSLIQLISQLSENVNEKSFDDETIKKC
jgi:hypothetical protein